MEELQKPFNGFDFSDFRSISETIDEAKEYIKTAQDGNRIVFSTKWERLDRQLMGGLQPGKTYIIGGRPGSGKSQFSNQLLFNVLEQAQKENRKVVVFYWSFEMPGYQQLIRIASGDLNTSVYDLIKPQTGNSSYQETLDKFKKYPIYFCNIPNTLIFAKGKINQFCKNNPDTTLINLFDHTRLLVGGNKEENQRIADLSKTCMESQAAYKTITILLSQLNRNIESPERLNNQAQPMLSDLFLSDALGQDAHVVMLINRPYDMYGIKEIYCGEQPQGLMALHLEKNRDGELGMVPFQTHYPSFKLTERNK